MIPLQISLEKNLHYLWLCVFFLILVYNFFVEKYHLMEY